MESNFDVFSDDELLEALARKAPLPERPNASASEIKRRRVNPKAPPTAPAKAAAPEEARYSPLDSVWYGEEDAELLERLLDFYPRSEPEAILDATVNGGRFWRGSSRKIIGLDVDPHHHPDVCADNGSLPFGPNLFDVVVYDPPHIPNQGKDRSKDFGTRFGLGARSSKENGYTFSHTFPRFMLEAWRVLKPEGILLCKIVDYVHNHRYQWAHIDLICAGKVSDLRLVTVLSKFEKVQLLIQSGRSPITAVGSTRIGSSFANHSDANSPCQYIYRCRSYKSTLLWH